VTTPVVPTYADEIEALRRAGCEPALVERMRQLVAQLDLATRLGSAASAAEIPEAALSFVMTELAVSSGALFLVESEGRFRKRAELGSAEAVADVLEPGAVPAAACFLPGTGDAAPAVRGFTLVCPVHRGGRPIALLALGPRTDGRAFGAADIAFLESLAVAAAPSLESGLVDEELRRANRAASVKVYQLQNLFDIGRELAAMLDEDAIERLVVTTVMGHFLATRTALYHLGPTGLELAHARGTRPGALPTLLPGDPVALARELPGPRPTAELAAGPLRETLTAARFALVVPLVAPGGLAGLLAVGTRPGGRPFAEEDLEFAAALVRQAQAALEGARLHRLRLAKERQDRDLAIARGIQQGLFPKASPRIEGFEIVGESRSCLEVGGDYYDFVPLPGQRLGLVIADVSGKGTPASLRMASVHAWLRALAGSESPARVLERLNRFVFESTEMSRYVTLFYGELDPARRRLAYVNAGHVPPFLVRVGGREERLRCGGPVLGLLDEVSLEAGEVELAGGDLLVAVTDGVTEAMSPSGVEFGDERVRGVLAAGSGGAAAATLSALVSAVDDWTGAAGCSDDLTALILRAT
jgi:sigma-B regulation protein RsbU (phosphoserine phosphatase)